MIELRVTPAEYARLRESIAKAEDQVARFDPLPQPSIDLRRIAGAIVGEQVAAQLLGCVRVFVQDEPIVERIREAS